MELRQFNKQAKELSKVNEKFLKRLKQKPPVNLDNVFREQHEEVFSNTDCLTCANCCSTTSPIFYQRDIERAAKSLRIKPGAFVDKYLRLDEDGDHVLKHSPCAFLGQDNYCTIYKDRPVACREYPHTNRKRIHQILDLTFRNTQVCPAVLKIVDNIRKQMGG
jgi:Fe-S-cluster containining protein